MSEGDQQVVFAKLDTGQEGGDEVLGYLHMQPSSENTFFLQSQQIEIDGEHVILAHEDENGDFIVVVESDQENPQSGILMQGLVEEATTSQEEDSPSTSSGPPKKNQGGPNIVRLTPSAQINQETNEKKAEDKPSVRETRRTKLTAEASEGASGSSSKNQASKASSSSSNILEKTKSWDSEPKPSTSTASNLDDDDDEDLFYQIPSRKVKNCTPDLAQQVSDVIKVIDCSLDEAEALINQDKLETAIAEDLPTDKGQEDKNSAPDTGKGPDSKGRAKRKAIPSQEAPGKRPKPGLKSTKDGKSAAPPQEKAPSNPEDNSTHPVASTSKSKTQDPETKSEASPNDASKSEKPKVQKNLTEKTMEKDSETEEVPKGKPQVDSNDTKQQPKRTRNGSKDEVTNGPQENESKETTSKKDSESSSKPSDSGPPSPKPKNDDEPSTATTENAPAASSATTPSTPTKTDTPLGKKRKLESSKEKSTSKKKKEIDIFDLIKKQKTPAYKPGLYRYPNISYCDPTPSVKTKPKKLSYTSLVTPKPPQNGVESPPPPRKKVPISPPRQSKKAPEKKKKKSPVSDGGFEIRVRIQPIVPESTTNYNCFKCPFTTTRLNNMVHHHKFKMCSSFLKENTTSDFNWEVDQLPITAKPPDKPKDEAATPPTPSKFVLKKISEKKVSNPLESSDSEGDDEERDSGQPKLKIGEVVWVEWRDLHRPAVVQDVMAKEKKALVTYIEHTTTARPSVKVCTKRITAFDNAQRNKKYLFESKSTSFGESVVKAVARAEDYLRKKCLGYELTANRFFFGEEVNLGSLDLEEMEPLPEGSQSISDVSDMEDENEDDAEDPIRWVERNKKHNEKLLKIARGRHVKAHLLGVYSTAIQSERHRKFHSADSKEKNALKKVSWFGPIDDEDQEPLFEYCLGVFKNNCKYGKSYDLVAYVFEVWVPEAIVKAISRLHKVSLEQAEEMFGMGRPT